MPAEPKSESVASTADNAEPVTQENSANASPLAAATSNGATPNTNDDIPVPAREWTHHIFHKLDERFVTLSRCVAATTMAASGTVTLAVGSLLLWALPFPWQLTVWFGWLLLLGLGIFSVYYWPRWEHNAWSYRVDDRALEIRHGVVWHVAVLIPLSRLQHVDLNSGPLERQWGLATLEVHTAGTRDAVHRIRGLDVTVASELRDQLIAATQRGSHAPASD